MEVADREHDELFEATAMQTTRLKFDDGYKLIVSVVIVSASTVDDLYKERAYARTKKLARDLM